MVYSGVCEFCGQQYVVDESNVRKSLDGEFFVSCKKVTATSDNGFFKRLCNGYVSLCPNSKIIIYEHPTVFIHA